MTTCICGLGLLDELENFDQVLFEERLSLCSHCTLPSRYVPITPLREAVLENDFISALMLTGETTDALWLRIRPCVRAVSFCGCSRVHEWPSDACDIRSESKERFP